MIKNFNFNFKTSCKNLKYIQNEETLLSLLRSNSSKMETES